MRHPILWSLAEQIAPSHTALLVIDLQNDFTASDGKLALRGIDTKATEIVIPTVNALIETARKRGVFVIWVRVVHSPDDALPNYLALRTDSDKVDDPQSLITLEGSTGADWHPDLLTRRDDEPEILKRTYSAFFGTPLQQVLGVRGIRTLLVCGCNINVCIHTTVADAFFRGYYTVLAEDACSTIDSDFRESFLKNHRTYFGKTCSVAEVKRVWNTSVENGI